MANDAEFMAPEFFECLMKFLNSRKPTPLGTGLGLEVTSSCFFYSANDYNCPYFDGWKPGAPRSGFANRLADYLRSGWIDAHHAYGDFDGTGGFTRVHAEACYGELARLGVTLPVFTNHGSEENVQNIGRDATYHLGDRPGSDAYHVDLMRAYGVRYIWTDSLVVAKPQGKLLFRRQPQPSGLLADVTLQDASAWTGFLRFRSTGVNAPNLSSLGHQLDQIDFDRFYDASCALVVYQHLGVLFRAEGQCKAATIEDVASRPEIFILPFRRLARERDEGRLWVAGLARALTYLDMTRSVVFEGDQGDLRVSARGESAGRTETFEGLTVYIDPSRPVHLRAGTDELPLQHNGPDHSGRYSVTVPPRKYEDIW